MKKHSRLFIAGMITISFFLHSCQSSKNLSFEKRRYSNGYYVDWAAKPKTKQDKSHVATIKNSKGIEQESLSISQESDVKENESPALSVDQLKNTTAQKPSAKKSKTAKGVDVIPVYKNGIVKVNESPVAMNSKIKEKLAKKLAYKLRDVETVKMKSSGSSDTPDWVIAILCILLPPLAVFLKFGIGNKFWISILLTLLFWIPGIIYAFIVCFS